jgi:hypothetical protein
MIKILDGKGDEKSYSVLNQIKIYLIQTVKDKKP